MIRQLLLVFAAYLLYQLVRAVVYGSAYAPGYKPFGDATKIINLERLLHVFVEPSIQAWVAEQHWLMDIADWTYLNAHYFVTLGALVFIYLRRNDSFYFVRNMFMIAMAIALVGYALYPTAPPRLMPEWGFTDSISAVHRHHGRDSGAGERARSTSTPPSRRCTSASRSWSASRCPGWCDAGRARSPGGCTRC